MHDAVVTNCKSTLRHCARIRASAAKYGSIGCPETSIMNYHYTLRNSPEQRSSQSSSTFSGEGTVISGN